VNELELIQLLTRSLPGNASVVAGAGDDCAVLDLGLASEYVLFKTDAVVEGVHFTSGTAGERVGHKALGRCLSDIAAMAGEPTAALIAIGLPANYRPEYVASIYEGINALAKKFGVAIVGGETTTNPGHIFISVALIGKVEKDKAILRKGSRPSDAIFITGELGGSFQGKHLDFIPRITEARWLAASFPIHAMIDLSDGLAGDLRHLLGGTPVRHSLGEGGSSASPKTLGAELLSAAIPISRAAKLQAKAESSAKPPLLAALTDGEDFELLFTTSSKDAVPLLDAWKREFPNLRLTCIGKITTEPGLKIRDKQGLRALQATGYIHFPG